LSRRTAPRPLAEALGEVSAASSPAGLLPRLQASWKELVGPGVAGEAEPVAEHGGRVTVACRSAVWAQELELLSADLLERLNGALGTPEDPRPVVAFRFAVGKP
jgi:predicted nucleic acid-binding Zn ribbon protein